MSTTWLIGLLIVLGFLFNSLMDGIAFSKGNRDLNTLWHLAKYLCFAAVVVLSALFGQGYALKKFAAIHFVILVVFILMGAAVWRIAYKFWRTIDWPDWA